MKKQNINHDFMLNLYGVLTPYAIMYFRTIGSSINYKSLSLESKSNFTKFEQDFKYYATCSESQKANKNIKKILNTLKNAKVGFDYKILDHSFNNSNDKKIVFNMTEEIALYFLDIYKNWGEPLKYVKEKLGVKNE
ncbi:hypothetical protein H2P43_001659 [Campylobacter jejuni]|nr:hypothetical protein [Campylobacter jejuni]EFS0701718.1 hypothetical protein [Campylobacter jejuni]EHS1057278.1 hypothetical protein [Campylobacter jejuni]EHS1059163.1 hypothetical protein [Campylobacter jejuni]EHS1060914.1 hypothetical protein [Campylobacter jejuni]